MGRAWCSFSSLSPSCTSNHGDSGPRHLPRAGPVPILTVTLQSKSTRARRTGGETGSEQLTDWPEAPRLQVHRECGPSCDSEITPLTSLQVR